MEDLVLNAEAKSRNFDDLSAIAVGTSHAAILSPEGVIEQISIEEAEGRLSRDVHIIVNRPILAKRFGTHLAQHYDVLELFAFIRPARHCLPTIRGMMSALTLTLPTVTVEDQAIAIRAAAEHLISDLTSETYRYRAGVKDVIEFMGKAGWLWAPLLYEPACAIADHSRDNGLLVWTALAEWEDGPPAPPAGDHPVSSKEAAESLKALLGDKAEERPAQQRYTEAATHAFKPAEMQDGPNLQLLEAGTGTGKTMGYLTPAHLWAERNEAPVWVSTFTKNLQRQIDQELTRIWPDPRIKDKRAVVRKGRENYLCLLNLEETLRAVMQRPGERDKTLLGLVLRWARFSRDGDMIGGDFPSWLGGYFGEGRIRGLTDRRGECLYSACAHYRKCTIEKITRKTKEADIVVANHALVLAQAANRPDDPDRPFRLVFDEGHHLFHAADSAFSLNLSGMEGAELRRWLRGKEQGNKTRARGLKSRVEEMVADDEDAKRALDAVLHAASNLPAVSWHARVSSMMPKGDFEAFLVKVRAHVFGHANNDSAHSLEAPINHPDPSLIEAADKVATALQNLMRPMTYLAAKLLQKLEEESDSLDSGDRGRLEAASRSLVLRADMVKQWIKMADGLGQPSSDDFVDWFGVEKIGGGERDVGFHRHFLDPTKPFADIVLAPAKGAIITSATLRDKAGDEDNWSSADVRTGVQHLMTPAKRLSVESPFDYAANTRVFVINDVNKQDPKQVAAAYRELMMASDGGALGLFTAINRLRRVYAEIASALADANIPLYAQHVDPIDTATLVDIFREEENACLLGTDAVRDGVDVPGNSLRAIIFDRTPWPRPTLLHKARRNAFGGREYDEMLTRLKIKQAYGRLVRRMDDRGVFIMLDAATPTRLLSTLPEGVEIERIGLADCIRELHTYMKS